MKLLSGAILVAICLLLGATRATAQEKVHALSGTVTVIHPKIQMTEIDTDDESSGHFEWLSKHKADTKLDFDKSLRADSTPADQFTAVHTHVIVYYIGFGDVRTIVALHNLGTGPLVKSVGHVVKWDRHAHLLTIKNQTGGVESFQVDDKTVVDTAVGAKDDLKFSLDKGKPVRVLAAQANGTQTALLITPAFI